MANIATFNTFFHVFLGIAQSHSFRYWNELPFAPVYFYPGMYSTKFQYTEEVICCRRTQLLQQCFNFFTDLCEEIEVKAEGPCVPGAGVHVVTKEKNQFQQTRKTLAVTKLFTCLGYRRYILRETRLIKKKS